MKKAMIIILSILGVLVLIGAGGILLLTNGLESGADLTINPVNLAEVKDGTYTGTYEGGRWSNEVEVTVANHQISNIDILKTGGMESTDISDTLINSIIEKQTINVETVSGATVTSKAYLKSIENALTQ